MESQAFRTLVGAGVSSSHLEALKGPAVRRCLHILRERGAAAAAHEAGRLFQSRIDALAKLLPGVGPVVCTTC